jgi:hypothetical protein
MNCSSQDLVTFAIVLAIVGVFAYTLRSKPK